jgi:hypothetical protein
MLTNKFKHSRLVVLCHGLERRAFVEPLLCVILSFLLVYLFAILLKGFQFIYKNE